MSDKVVPGPVQDLCGIREAVCIHTKKIYDSCKEEDIASYKQSQYGLRNTSRENSAGLVFFFFV